MHFYKVLNVLAWESAVNITFPDNTQFTLKTDDPVTFNLEKRMGIIQG